MRIFFHEDFHKVYAHDPAAERGRLVPAAKLLARSYEVVTPERIEMEHVERVHGRGYIEEVHADGGVWTMALLAAGAALGAARLAIKGEPAFALARPPGHHASANSGWGFCFLNNVAISVAALVADGSARSVLVLDFDLHLGDGTRNIFSGRESVRYLHPEGQTRGQWIESCRAALEGAGPCDVVAVSAGFDRHEDDWGGLLATEDYRTIGSLVRGCAEARCSGRWFAVLEGGYNPDSLAESADAFISGACG